ncbi:PAS domain-containing protein [Nocardioides sambongensis]|uniref:PAS domain-containing protein n=1 Tax=Nocardioides sambongensis TaxID=2589074 RepID=UPI00112C66ED|nr:PAS domain-containing protein [Nocardioides sambongensis]
MSRREFSLAGQFLLLQLVVVAALLTIVAVLSIRQSDAAFERERGAQMRSVAEYVANLEPLRVEMAAAADPDDPASTDFTPGQLAPYVDRGINLAGATEVSVVGVDGRVYASSDRSQVGEEVDLGGSDVLDGRQWSGDVETDDGRAVAAHAPVLNDRGELIGVVVAEQTYPTLAERFSGAAPDLLLFLGVGAVLGGLGSFAVSRLLKRRSQGLAPTQIAELADHRQALLHAIREGVVAVGTDGRVTMMNDAARATLGVEGGDPRGRPVRELGLPGEVVDLLVGRPRPRTPPPWSPGGWWCSTAGRPPPAGAGSGR